MQFKRKIMTVLKQRLGQFPIAVLTGPRQSGKTTLLEQLDQHYDYINLESPDELERLQIDPRGILNRKKKRGLIIDEAQKYPDAFSYIQTITDKNKKKGEFILSGSQNFLLNQQITQSLAGRSALLELLPLTYDEYLTHPNMQPLDVWTWLFQGGYPRPYQDGIPVQVWMDTYVRTYLERDVRDLLQVRDLNLFQKFLRLCAGRHGQLFNASQVSIDCGISHTTVSHWLSILEASYIVFRLQPYHNNFNKRLTKTPKLYFYDSGLVCYLLGITSPDQLNIHAMRGAIFEGYVISEIKKNSFNKGESKPLYFWRDSNGVEVDCIFESNGRTLAIEIKSTTTIRKELFKHLQTWQKISNTPANNSCLIYAGDNADELLGMHIVPWNGINAIDLLVS
jgi:hypothetical protein